VVYTCHVTAYSQTKCIMVGCRTLYYTSRARAIPP
jgi:hypothetical protein